MADKDESGVIYFSWAEDLPFGEEGGGDEGRIYISKAPRTSSGGPGPQRSGRGARGGEQRRDAGAANPHNCARRASASSTCINCSRACGATYSCT